MRDNPIFLPLDRPDLATASALAEAAAPHLGGLKAGLELFTAEGPRAVERLAGFGLPLFLDLKLHDIPNTVGSAVRSLQRLPWDLLTVHAAGGRAMVEAAAQAAGSDRTVLAVTVLTSLNDDDLRAAGVAGGASDQALRLAELALDAGAGGLVCSPKEVAAMRRRFGSVKNGGPKLVVPGVRPAGSEAGDQRRTATPREALDAGADILVIGRPISASPDPAAAAEAIARDLGVAR